MHKVKYLALPAAALFAASAALAQQQAAPAVNHLAAYDLKREGTLVGTVTSYTAAASTAPFGARLTLQTGSGVVDVHLGDARLLAANKFNIHSGDTLRIIGETVTLGSVTQFVARIVQNGNQAVAVRSTRGFPLSYVASRNINSSKPQGGVL
jgi:hypothetical protein